MLTVFIAIAVEVQPRPKMTYWQMYEQSKRLVPYKNESLPIDIHAV